MLFKLLIEPFDTLFFRDGKPFDIAEETIANSRFMPLPSTIHGAITSLVLSQNKIPLNLAQELKNSIKIKDIALYSREEERFLYPIPLDLIIPRKEQDHQNLAKKLKLDSLKNAKSNLNYNQVLVTNMEGENKGNFYISDVDLENYLSGDFEDIYYEDEIFSIEYKIGIGLDNKTKSVSEGKLYRIPLIRFLKDKKEKIKLFVEFEIEKTDNLKNLNIDDCGYIKLGGENKISFYEKVDINPDININTEKTEYFKIYFKAPAIFKDGYLPNWILNGSYKGIKFEFITASIDRYKIVSGFDLKENKIKQSYKAIPEGSVFYLKAEEDFKKVQSIFESESLSDFYKNEGFGLVKVGIYKGGNNGN